METKYFYRHYNKLCKRKNIKPIQEMKEKLCNILDFHPDRIKYIDWLIILECLSVCQNLTSISVRSRKCYKYVMEKVDTEKKCRNFYGTPIIITKYIFSKFVHSITELLQCNNVITTLCLEGLPLSINYVQLIAKGISKNGSLLNISFARSAIGDDGCQIICTTVKFLQHIENVNFSECQLSFKGAEALYELFKYQKIFRYSESWKKSLRYRDVDPDSIPGLKTVLFGNNPEIGDEGLELILEILKEDVWIKAIDVQNCGITDKGGQAIIDCLEHNRTIMILEVKRNDIGVKLMSHIDQLLGNTNEDLTSENISLTPRSCLQRESEKVAFLQQELETEKMNRKKVEALNDQLHYQMLEQQNSYVIKDGYTLVSNDELDKMISKINELKKLKLIKDQKKQKTTHRISSKATPLSFFKNQENSDMDSSNDDDDNISISSNCRNI